MEESIQLASDPEESSNADAFDRKYNMKGATENEVVINALSMLEILWEKNKKYGDAWKRFGIYSAISNVNEKAQRLVSMCWDEKKQDWRGSSEDFLNDVEEEGSIYDTVKDLAGFALLAMSLFDKKRDERLVGAMMARERI